MIVVLPNQYENQSVQRLIRDGFAITTRQCGGRSLNVAHRVPTLRNVVQLRRKQ